MGDPTRDFPDQEIEFSLGNWGCWAIVDACVKYSGGFGLRDYQVELRAALELARFRRSS